MRRYNASTRHNFLSNRPSRNRSLFSWPKKTTRSSRPRVITQQAISTHFIPRRQRVLSRNQSPRRNYWPIIKFFVLPILLLSWIGIMLFVPYFRITSVDYYGLTTIKKDVIDAYVTANFLHSRFSWWPARNYFLLNRGGVEKNLKNHFSFGAVTVKKIFPNQLIIDITEKISSVIYDDGRNYYLLDQSGQIIKLLRPVLPEELKTVIIKPPTINQPVTSSTLAAATTTIATITPSSTVRIDHTPNINSIRQEFGAFPVVYSLADSNNETPTATGTTIFDASIVAGILEWQTLVEQRGIGRVNYFLARPNALGLTVLINQPWNIQFDPASDLKQQADNVQLILRENRPKQYIDVRFGDRAYWK